MTDPNYIKYNDKSLNSGLGIVLQHDSHDVSVDQKNGWYLNLIKNFQILNDAHLIKKGTETEIEPDGKISLHLRLLGTIKENIVFKEFPFHK